MEATAVRLQMHVISMLYHCLVIRCKFTGHQLLLSAILESLLQQSLLQAHECHHKFQALSCFAGNADAQLCIGPDNKSLNLYMHKVQ